MARKIIPAGQRKGDVTFKLGDPLPSSRKKSSGGSRKSTTSASSSAPSKAPMPARKARTTSITPPVPVKAPRTPTKVNSVTRASGIPAVVSDPTRPVMTPEGNIMMRTMSPVTRGRVDNEQTRVVGKSGPTQRKAPSSPRGNNPRRIGRSMEMMRKRINRTTRNR